MSFADLKRSSSSDFSFLQKELEKASTDSKGDERIWKPALNETGNGYAVIRFLPRPTNEPKPLVKLYSHAFQGPENDWFIENCLTTNGEKCPICNSNSVLWKNGDEDTARERKRKLSYYSNIYVVKDTANPDNEGKVFLYRYGKMIFDKIAAAMKPEFDDEKPVNVFDLWEGANFKLKIKIKGGYWNYEASEFDAPAALSNDDDQLEAVYNQCYSLQELVSPEQFKSFSDLEKRMDDVLNPAKRRASSAQAEEEADPISSDDDDLFAEPVAARPARSSNIPSEDKGADYFASLLED
jgi:hypothetical protein